MLKRENTLEMAINTINTINEDVISKDALLLLGNYRDLMKMYINSTDRKYEEGKLHSRALSDENLNIINNHIAFFNELLKSYMDTYNDLLIENNLKESKTVLQIIRDLQHLLEFELNFY